MGVCQKETGFNQMTLQWLKVEQYDYRTHDDRARLQLIEYNSMQLYSYT